MDYVLDLQLLSECYLAFAEHKYAETSPFSCWFAFSSLCFVNYLLEYANTLINELQDSVADSLQFAWNLTGMKGQDEAELCLCIRL